MSHNKVVHEIGFVSRPLTSADWLALMPENVVRLRIKFGPGDQDFEWVHAGICRKLGDMMVLEFDYCPTDPDEPGKRLPERHGSIRIFEDELDTKCRVWTAPPNAVYPYSRKTQEEEKKVEQLRKSGNKRKGSRPNTATLANSQNPPMAA